MQPGPMILMEGVLSFGVPLAVAVRELLLLHRRPPPPNPRPPAAAPRAPSPSATTPPVRPRTRVLEDA